MKVLIIDDSEYKIKSLSEFIKERQHSSEIIIARSFQCAIREIKVHRPALILLDMTLPTSTDAMGQLEGRVRIFGGREILSEMDLEGITSNVIVFTQFDHFGEQTHSVDRETLFGQLAKQFPNVFIGGIYYSNIDSHWRGQLSALLNKHRISL
jgi:CheY-like chemotaxis protein